MFTYQNSLYNILITFKIKTIFKHRKTKILACNIDIIRVVENKVNSKMV